MHFLNKDELWRARAIQRPCAAVKVRFTRKARERVLTVEHGFVAILGHDAIIAPLPKDVVVVTEDGEAIEASRGFWVTIETFDPWHLLMDFEPSPLHGPW